MPRVLPKDAMSGDTKETVKFEQALSDRSTCRATGERIAKGEWRVGIEVWLAGRMSWTWQVVQYQTRLKISS